MDSKLTRLPLTVTAKDTTLTAVTDTAIDLGRRHCTEDQISENEQAFSQSDFQGGARSPERSRNLTTVGGLAEACGIGPSTIRHYQNIGLIPKPARAQYGGFRRYSQEDVERLSLIRLAQEIGFTLKEIGEILRYRKKGDFSALCALITSRKSAIQNEIQALNRNLESLSTLSAGYSDNHNVDSTGHESSIDRHIPRSPEDHPTAKTNGG